MVSRAIPFTLIALAFTLLNAVKPPHIDDAPYFWYAEQIAQQPLSPYGFEIPWGNELRPANHLLAPPVLLYWWAAGIRLFGQSPFLWKLWLLPFSMILVAALYSLFRRFAHRHCLSLVILVVFSPALLPSLNLMLDVPALALQLAAVALYLRGADRQRWGQVFLAGLVGGLAMQTKYTALVLPGIFVADGIFRLRVRGARAAIVRAPLTRKRKCASLRFAVLAALMCCAVFASWELFVIFRHGESHFLYHAAERPVSLVSKITRLGTALLSLLGGLATPLIPVGLLALGCRQRWALASMGVVVAGYVVFATLPIDSMTLLTYREGRTSLEVGHVIFGGFGIGVLLIALLSARKLFAGGRSRTVLFLLAWLIIEMASYFLLTPFPAARRILGVWVVLCLIVGRLIGRIGNPSYLRLAVGFGVLIGLGFYLVDLADACAARQTADDVSTFLHDEHHCGEVWFTGGGGFEFQARTHGFKPLIYGHSALRAGDVLVVGNYPYELNGPTLEHMPLRKWRVVRRSSGLSVHTAQAFYGGRMPLERDLGFGWSATIYHVTEDVPLACRAPRETQAAP